MNCAKKVEKIVGFPEVRFDEERKLYCVTWKISKYSSNSSNSFRLRSPLFSVVSAYKCKWYLSLEPECIGVGGGGSRGGGSSGSSLRLVLDRESDCKEIVGNFKLFISDGRTPPSPNPSYNFKFAPKSENGNSHGIMYTISANYHVMNLLRSTDAVTIVCEMAINSIISEPNPLSVDFGSMLNDKLYTDIELSVGDKKYPAHRAVLAARSSVFASILANKLPENEAELRIEDVSENIMEAMLRYIYTGEVEILDLDVNDLWCAAGKYNVRGLQIMCEDNLMASLSSSNAMEVLTFANVHDGCELKSKVLEFIWNQGTEVMKTDAWELIAHCDPELLKEVCENGFRFVQKLKN